MPGREGAALETEQVVCGGPLAGRLSQPSDNARWHRGASRGTTAERSRQTIRRQSLVLAATIFSVAAVALSITYWSATRLLLQDGLSDNNVIWIRGDLHDVSVRDLYINGNGKKQVPWVRE